MKNNRAVGNAYERIAGEHLQSLGYEILEYNFRCRQGEVDLVARHGEYFVFVEVKYRKNANKGQPSEAIQTTKKRRISRCAQQYLYQHRLQDVPVRFDVVSILDKEISVLQNAFEYLS